MNRLQTFILLFCLHSMKVLGQSGLERAAGSLEKFTRETFQEKIFVHLDRSFYLTGDYLRCKIYCVDASTHRLTDLSKIVYVELLDDDQKPVLQCKLMIQKGSGDGSFFLPTAINSGNYTFRAYTRWMQNFSPEFFFQKAIAIINPFRTPERKEISSESPVCQAYLFPEGGWLVRGLTSKVAFKVIGPNGRGIRFKGMIMNSKGENLVAFEPTRFGMGHFDLTPQPGERYRAILTDSMAKPLVTISLPDVLDHGYVLRLSESAPETLQLQVSTTISNSTAENIFLLAHTRGQIRVKQSQQILNGKASFAIDKKELGEGVTQFTVISAAGVPVAERLYFKPPVSQLGISVNLSAQKYPIRSKVDLTVAVDVAARKDIDSDLSISVFRLDSLQVGNQEGISSYFQLTSDLAGEVESPAYYFSNEPGVHEMTDNLMLTNGWRRFLWSELLPNDGMTDKLMLANGGSLSGNENLHEKVVQIPEYRAHTLIGKITHADSGEPANGVLTYLSVPGKRFHFVGYRSDKNGDVRFELPEFYGLNRVIVQTNVFLDSVHKIEIKNPFSGKYGSQRPIPLALSKTMESQILSRSLSMQMENIYFEKERSKIKVPQLDSAAFYNDPDERYFLDNYTRFPTIEDVMREYVPGVFVHKQKKNFHFSVANKEGRYSFDNDPLILLDGTPIFNVNSIMEFDPLKVKRLDVVTHRYFYGPLTFDGIVSYSTYKGDLGGFPLSPRAVSTDYQGVAWEREFFAPRYDTPHQVASRLPDFRNLLMWIPNARPDKTGTYHADFYTSDQPGRYLIFINGQAANGLSGSASAGFEVDLSLK